MMAAMAVVAFFFSPPPYSPQLPAMNLRVFPPEEMIDGSVELPFSKSFANRAMLIDVMAGTPLPLPDPALCGSDILTMHRILSEVAASAPSAAVDGVNVVDVGDAGTAMRFLTAFFAASEGRRVELRGSARMHCRPIGPLVDALRSLGGSVEWLGEEGFPPLAIEGRRLEGGEIEIDSSVSSQFVSALMMAAPLMEKGLVIRFRDVVASRPYILLTAEIMKRRGIDVEPEPMSVTVAPGRYNAESTEWERDWSAAAFWAELCAVTAGFIGLEGVSRDSSQPDAALIGLFAELGVGECEPDDDDDDAGSAAAGAMPGDLPGIMLCGSPEISPRLVRDFSSNPDLVQPAMVTCVLIGVPFRFSGLTNLVAKETDRLEALRAEMARLGVVVDTDATAGTASWEGRRLPISDTPRFATYGDHRMAMALAPAAVFLPGIIIEGAESVEKSYPGFWQQLERLGFIISDADAEPAGDNSAAQA